MQRSNNNNDKNRPDRRAHNSSGWKCVHFGWWKEMRNMDKIYLLPDLIGHTQSWIDARCDGESFISSYCFCNIFGKILGIEYSRVPFEVRPIEITQHFHRYQFIWTKRTRTPKSASKLALSSPVNIVLLFGVQYIVVNDDGVAKFIVLFFFNKIVFERSIKPGQFIYCNSFWFLFSN